MSTYSFTIPRSASFRSAQKTKFLTGYVVLVFVVLMVITIRPARALNHENVIGSSNLPTFPPALGEVGISQRNIFQVFEEVIIRVLE